MPSPNNNSENIVNSKYYNISQIKSLKNCDDNKSFSFFHLNTCLLSKNIDDCKLLIISTKIDFEVCAISESKIITNKSSVVNCFRAWRF